MEPASKSNPGTQLEPYVFPTMNIKTSDHIEVAINSDPRIKTIVHSIGSNYQTINVEDAMTKLTQVGKLLQLAYCGGKGHTCSPKIMKILADYHSLINISSNVTNTFVATTIKALDAFRSALLIAEKGNISLALTKIANTAKLADEMGKLSGEMITLSKVLCDESAEALVAATEEEYKTTEKKGQAQLEIDKLKVRQDKLTIQTKDLNEAINDAKEEEAKLLKQANEIRQKAFAVSIVTAVIQPLASAAGIVGATFASPAAAIVHTITTTFNTLSKKMEAKDKIEGDLQSSLTKLLDTEKKTKEELNQTTQEIEQEKLKLKELQEKLIKENDGEAKLKIEKDILLTEESIKSLETAKKSKEKFIQEVKESLEKITNIMETQVKSLENREMKIMKQRTNLQKELRDANSELIGTITELKSSANNMDSLKESIKSLELVVKTLGKIRTIFENTRLFWMGAKKQCEALANSDDVKNAADLISIAPEYKIEFINSIKFTGLNWLSLAQINRLANISMLEVKKGMDEFLMDIPGKEKALDLIKILSVEMLNQIEEEDKITEEI